MLFSCISPFLVFGFIAAFISTKNVDKEDTTFMVGLWKFRDTKAFIFYILAIIIVVGLPAGLLVLIIPKVIKAAALAFIIKVIGVTWAGFALILPMSIIQKRFSWIDLHPQDETE